MVYEILQTIRFSDNKFHVVVKMITQYRRMSKSRAELMIIKGIIPILWFYIELKTNKEKWNEYSFIKIIINW